MKKTTLKTLFTLLALLLVFVMVFTVAACAATEDTTTDDTASDDKDTSTKTSKNLVFSEDFSETSGTDQPYSPSSSWTTYTNNSDANKKVAGVIDTGASYDSAKTAWDSLKNPYGDPKDNKLLMIYNKEANVYGYHRSFQTAVATYYTITASVKTVNIVGTGASFRILSNNGTAAFSISDTDDFQTYTFYVLSALAKSDTINIYLTLGYGTDKVSGYAFFDDIEVKKISSADYKAAYEAAQENENPSNTKFVEMLQPDGEFNYYTSTTTTPYTASSWSTKTGGKVDDKALETNNTARGIVSTEAENWKTLSKAHVITLEKEPEAEEATKLYYFPEDSNPGITAAVSDNGDKNVLALRSMPTPNGSNAKYTPTAIGYESKTSIRINMSTIYEISVWVKASVDVDPEHENDPDYYKDRGAAVILNGTEKYSVKAIRTNNATNNGWEKVVFYIIGNEYSAKDFTIELWLGTDDSKDTLTQGVAYFDKLVVKEIETFTADTREEKVSEYKNIIQNEVAPGYVTRYADLIDLKSVKANMVTNHDFSTLDEAARPEGYTFAGIDSVVVNDGVDVIAKMISAEAIAATDEQWTETYKDIYKIDANPLYPYGFSNVLLVNNVLPSAYKVTQNQEIEIIQNLNYRLSVWVKTINLADSDNLTIALIDGDGTSKSTFSVNTNKTSASNDETEQDYANAYSNELLKGYVEYIFYIQGCNASDPNAKIKSDMVHLEFSLGSGTKYEPSGYRKGAYVIANINMEQITNPEYTSATTGTTANKVSFSSDSSNISNGNFNQYDLKNSEIDQDTGLPKLKDEFGNDGYYLAAIGGSDWTNNVNEGYGTTKVEQKTDKDDPSKVEEVKVNNLIAGILNINNTNSNDSNAYLKQFGLDDVEIFNNWATSVIDETKEKSVYFGKPNVLMITTRGNASVKLKNTYKENESDENEKTNDKSETPAIKSPSLSFDPNSYYVVKFYARAIGNVEKAIGQVYLTTSSTDAEKALHTIKVEDGWVEYIFLVETGLSKVEANLEIYFGEKFNLTTEYQGTLLFDGFTKVSIDKDAYDKYLTYESTKTTKFATTTFDTGSTTSETAVKPTLFSGSGASTSGYENSESQVAGVITYNSFKFDGAENKKTLGLLTTKTETDAEGNEKTTDVLIEGSAMSRDEIFSDEGMDDATVGNYLLIINNRKDSFYTYETTSLSLKGGSFYKFSAYVRTAWLAKGKNAMAKITIGEDTYTLNVNTGTYDDAGKETIGGWKIINFYIHNEKSDATDAKLAFILGENTDAGKLQGYYFIDNVSLYTIDEDQFTTETAAFRDFTQDENGADVQTEANKTFRLSNSVIELKDEETTEEKDTDNDDNDSTDDSDSGLNMTLLWTYITSIAIAVVLIAVIVVWLIKKYRRPKKSVGAGNTTASYDRNNATKPEEQKDEGTGSARNEYKD